MKTLTLFCLFASFGLSALAETNPVDGWREAKWGMTQDQVIAAFKGEAVRPPEGKWATKGPVLEIPEIKIEGVIFHAIFAFSEDGKKLNRVTISTTDGKEGLFANLEQRLTEKYGKTDFENDSATDTQVKKKRAWNRGITRIQLELTTLYLPEMKPLITIWSIEYSQLPKVGDSNL